MVDIDVLAYGRNCEQIGNEPDDPNGAIDVRLLLDMLIIPGSHTQPHFLHLILPGQLSIRIEIEALVDIPPSLQVKVQLVPDIRQVAGHICEDNGHSDHNMDVALVKLEETR